MADYYEKYHVKCVLHDSVDNIILVKTHADMTNLMKKAREMDNLIVRKKDQNGAEKDEEKGELSLQPSDLFG